MLGARYDSARSDRRPADRDRQRRHHRPRRADVTWRLRLVALPQLQRVVPAGGGHRTSTTSATWLRGEQWEVGVKFATADGRFAFNAAVYDLKEKNRRSATRRIRLNQLQTGETTNRGVELGGARAASRRRSPSSPTTTTSTSTNSSSRGRRTRRPWAMELRRRRHRRLLGRTGAATRKASRTAMSAARAVGDAARRAARVGDAAVAAGLNASNLLDKTYVATCLSRGDCWWARGATCR